MGDLLKFTNFLETIFKSSAYSLMPVIDIDLVWKKMISYIITLFSVIKFLMILKF